jgi:hypothetical protein
LFHWEVAYNQIVIHMLVLYFPKNITIHATHSLTFCCPTWFQFQMFCCRSFRRFWKLGPLCKVSKGFSRILKPSTNFIQSHLSGHSAFWFSSLFFNNDPVCPHLLYINEYFFLFGVLTILKFTSQPSHFLAHPFLTWVS